MPPERWLIMLTAAEIAELEAAGDAFLSLGKDVGEISAEDFPLPTLGLRLVELRRQLLHGVGV